MRASDQKLIQRLQERNADRKRATDGGIHRRKPFLTATTKEIEVAEQEIGFEFPELLHAIYSQVGNGGFGPAYGIVGFKWGQSLDGYTLESCHRKMEKLERTNTVWRWPKRLLPLANYGCGMWSCVDCEYQRFPLVLWDPNNLHATLDGADARLNWGSAFWDQGLSLRTWLEGWLAQKPEPEPKRPSDSWMQKRLGFSLPK
jgi:hypothetical protein